MGIPDRRAGHRGSVAVRAIPSRAIPAEAQNHDLSVAFLCGSSPHTAPAQRTAQNRVGRTAFANPFDTCHVPRRPCVALELVRAPSPAPAHIQCVARRTPHMPSPPRCIPEAEEDAERAYTARPFRHGHPIGCNASAAVRSTPHPQHCPPGVGSRPRPSSACLYVCADAPHHFRRHSLQSRGSELSRRAKVLRHPALVCAAQTRTPASLVVGLLVDLKSACDWQMHLQTAHRNAAAAHIIVVAAALFAASVADTPADSAGAGSAASGSGSAAASAAGSAVAVASGNLVVHLGVIASHSPSDSVSTIHRRHVWRQRYPRN
mmetsp:Transcript_66796/g.110982  ORF Transcript_66796/g.110982 Transcript_66796/m.110982 type:complete len:319 (-) Transcript_66796:156-1112(-)